MLQHGVRPTQHLSGTVDLNICSLSGAKDDKSSINEGGSQIDRTRPPSACSLKGTLHHMSSLFYLQYMCSTQKKQTGDQTPLMTHAVNEPFIEPQPLGLHTHDAGS